MRRNDFIKAALAAGMLWKPGQSSGAVINRKDSPGPLPRRPLGKTGERLSIIGFGGIIIRDEPQPSADRAVREAYEAGVNYFDVAPRYGDAQDRMGPALEPFRKNVFLSCKTQERDRAGSQRELEDSLKKLRTDYFDLYQHHYLNSKEDIDKVFGPSGSMETLVRAKEKGLTRFLGFSAHTVEAAFAAMERYDFDTVMFPLNYVNWYKGNFGRQVVEKAHAKGMGIVAIKPGARCPRDRGEKDEYTKCWYRPFKTDEDVARSYYFTLSLPVTAALPPGDERLFKMALAAARSFIPLDDSDRLVLKTMAESENRALFNYPEWQG